MGVLDTVPNPKPFTHILRPLIYWHTNLQVNELNKMHDNYGYSVEKNKYASSVIFAPIRSWEKIPFKYIVIKRNKNRKIKYTLAFLNQS